MIRLLGIALVLLGAGCSSAPHPEKTGQGGALREPDNMCLNDCLGHGGERRFCEERCTD